MITLVIYGVIAVVLAASAGYAFMTFSSSSRQLTQLQENQVRMETATASLRASLLALSADGVVYPPEGSYTAGQPYTYLPSSLGVVSAAPWGQPYLYCPVSQTGASNARLGSGTADNVVSPSGATYAIGYISNTLTQGNKYVITSSQPNNISAVNAPGYIAFIVSTLGPGQQMPDCSQIVVAAGGLSAPGATVRGITGGFSFLQRVNASSDRMEIFVGNTATGDTTGRDVNNLTTIDRAMALWAAIQPRLGMIYLENSVTTTSNFDAVDFSNTDIQNQNASLVIETDPTIVSGGAVTLTLSNNLILPVATTFQNLTITAPGSIRAYKPLKFRNVTFNSAGGTTISAYATDVVINDSSFSNTILYGANSRISFLNYSTTQTTFTGSIAGNDTNIDFESAVPGQAASYSLTPAGGPMIVTTGGNVTIGNTNIPGYAPVVGTTNVASSGQFSINGGNLFINGNGGLQSPIAAANVSPIFIANGTANFGGIFNATSTSAAVQSVGSNIYVSGTLNANSAGGAIQALASTVTGSGTINRANGSPCVTYLTGTGAGSNSISIYPATTNGYPSFAEARYGMTPMPGFDQPGTLTAVNTAVVASLTAANGVDPVLSLSPNSVTVAGASGTINASSAYLDPATFEAAVRYVVNREFSPGLDIYFTGACN